VYILGLLIANLLIQTVLMHTQNVPEEIFTLAVTVPILRLKEYLKEYEMEPKRICEELYLNAHGILCIAVHKLGKYTDIT